MLTKFFRIKFYLLFFLLFTGVYNNVSAQKNRADSLLYSINHTNNNKQKLGLLIDYCKEYRYILPDSCLKYATFYFNSKNNVLTNDNSALMLLLGDIYWHLGEMDSSINKYELSYEFFRKTNNKKGISQSLGDIGYIKMEQGKYPESLMNYKEALKIARQIGDDEYIGVVGLYISQLYDWMGEYDEALKMYHEMKVHFEKNKSHKSYGVVLMNIGAVHGNNKMLDSALVYYDLALKFLPIKEERSIAITKMNIAFVYMDQKKDLSIVKKLIDEAIPVFKKINSISNLALANYYEGLYYIEKKDYEKSKNLFQKAINHYKVENNHSRLTLLYDKLSFVFEKQHKIDSAYFFYKLFKQYSDSVLNKLSANNMSYQRVMFDTDKKQLEIKTLEQKQLIQNEQLDKEKTQRYAMYGGILLLVVFGAFMFNRFKVTQRQKKIIEIKERETQEQKYLIEEKHKEITDSINYAERIQRSFLATAELLNENLKEYFVFFQPKDVVSGDFYWASKLNNGTFALVTADSTGHGVPGAIMSILNITCLENAIKEGNKEPAEILNHTRINIIERLKKDGSKEGGKDGMDASLICFDFEKSKLIYASANNPVWVVRENQIIELVRDKMPVGKHDKDTIPFTQNEFALQKGDVVYALTDGLPDQFGGPKGKKFMYKQLKDVLVSISSEPMETQKQKLADSLNYWKGNMEQVDDITLVGVRV